MPNTLEQRITTEPADLETARARLAHRYPLAPPGVGDGRGRGLDLSAAAPGQGLDRDRDAVVVGPPPALGPAEPAVLGIARGADPGPGAAVLPRWKTLGLCWSIQARPVARHSHRHLARCHSISG